MESSDLLNAYMARTGQTKKEVFSGLMAFGMDFTFELIKQAQKENKTLVFYYETDYDAQIDRLSYKLE